MLLCQLHPAVVNGIKLEVTLPPQLGSLSRGVLLLVLDLLGNLWGAGAPKLELPASGITISFTICCATLLSVMTQCGWWLLE